MIMKQTRQQCCVVVFHAPVPEQLSCRDKCEYADEDAYHTSPKTLISHQRVTALNHSYS